jgi:hypothetical protein
MPALHLQFELKRLQSTITKAPLTQSCTEETSVKLRVCCVPVVKKTLKQEISVVS